MATSTLLVLKSTFFGHCGELFTGTATGGSTATLADTSLVGYASETWPTKFEGQQLRVTSGSASGDLRLITRLDRSEGGLYPNRVFSAAIASTDTYEVWGSAIQGGVVLTNLFNDVIRHLRPITDTQITIVTSQNIYDLTTTVQTRRDIEGLYVRHLDTANLAPYRIQQLRRGVDWEAYDRGGAGTTAVSLDLFRSLTLNTALNELWLRHRTTFTAFSTSVDTGTVDAVYRDWLAWAAVHELCRRKAAGAAVDKGRWKELQQRAQSELAYWRGRFLPREPIKIATFP